MKLISRCWTKWYENFVEEFLFFFTDVLRFLHWIINTSFIVNFCYQFLSCKSNLKSTFIHYPFLFKIFNLVKITNTISQIQFWAFKALNKLEKFFLWWTAFLHRNLQVYSTCKNSLDTYRSSTITNTLQFYKSLGS